MHRITAACVILAVASLAGAVERPFIWMNEDEIDAARERLENEPWAETAYERMFSYARGGDAKSFRRLFDYMVRGDEQAGEREKQILLQFIGYEVDHRPWSDQYINAIRYDIFYDELTHEQREQIEQTMRVHIQAAIDWERDWTRTSWLPNMQWPRKFSSHLLAVALQDEELIHRIAEVRGSWMWYMDEYVADGQFYMEEFGKQYSMIGEMLLWCRGLQRLGMDQLGFGYVGTGGATMKSYLSSYFTFGYPRTEIPGGLGQYPHVTMGDARGGPQHVYDRSRFPRYSIDQHANVASFLPDGRGGDAHWMGANMNGRDHRWQIVEKMVRPLWFEIAHKQWPDAGFDYFLAQMRHPGDETYIPTLFYDLDPIDPDDVRPPEPAPSGVYRERGFAMLRADESPSYWESASPAVALQFSMYYVHYTHDSFSLLGYYALNRPIYYNCGISAGYAGDDPWTDSVRGHAGVVVDSRRASFVDDGNEGTPNHRVRQDLDGPARFVAVQAEGVYRDVDQERALVLTDEYLFDAFRLKSDYDREYGWQVHALGSHHPAEGRQWSPTDELAGGVLYDRSIEGMANRLEQRGDRYDLKEVRRFDAGDRAWSVTMVQDFAGDDVEQSELTPAWYERGVGVRVSMLPEAGTEVFTGKTPTYVGEPFEEPETGGVTLMVRREKPETTFAALHEPFEGGKGGHRIDTFERVAQTGGVLAARIAGDGIDDRVLVHLGHDRIGEPVSLAGENGERFTFTDYAFIRIGDGEVVVTGELNRLQLRVDGPLELIINGRTVKAEVSDGLLRYHGR
ncbi:MAG: hypothetical protein ACOC9S_01130 [Planctomycetota bacterium]